MRLIDADMLLNSFKGAKKLGVDAIKYYVDNAPTIDLVRCGECKHQVKQWHEDNRRKDKGFYIYWCDRNEDPFVAHTVSGEPTDFCSYGEREAEDFNPYQGERDRDENGEIY